MICDGHPQMPKPSEVARRPLALTAKTLAARIVHSGYAPTAREIRYIAQALLDYSNEDNCSALTPHEWQEVWKTLDAELVAVDPLATPASERAALRIYAVMARDWSDALDMVTACQDRGALNVLLKMLTLPGSGATDGKLNALFVEPVRRRIEKLQTCVEPPADRTGCVPEQVNSRFNDEGES